MTEPRICIVGAGSSGIAAAKTLHERGIEFDCFEKGSAVGGLWRYDNDNGMSAAYKSLHINTSRYRMAYSDFPMPRHYADFPHHSQIIEYFEKYVDHFGFRDKITFQTSITCVQPQDDGTFCVATEDQQGRRDRRRYDAVVVANGHHWRPRYPEFEGEFSGQTLHSHDYRTPDSMTGKRVLVVGIGNSGCDISCEVSRVAAKTFLAARRGVHVIPKYIFGKPMDKLAPEWMWRYLPFRLFQLLFAAALKLSRGSQRRFGLPQPSHRILEEHPTISPDLLNHIGHGRVHIKPGISRLAGDEVCFADGSQEEIDAIVYATGYHVSVPFLDSEVFSSRDNEVRLYKMVVDPVHPGLYFVGLIQPWGAIMPLADEQSKWIADLVEGKCGLPSPSRMLKDIEKQREKVRRRYTDSPRHTIQVDFYPYRAQIQKERKRKGNSAAIPSLLTVRERLLRDAA